MTLILRVMLLSILVLGAGCEEPFPNASELETLKGLWGLSAKPPADPTNRIAANADAIALGESLFHDPSLSSCGTVACATCHEGEGLAYDEPTAPGCDGHRTGRNPPTLLNVAHVEWLMWDGRADRLWNQPVLPLLSPVEMASNPALLKARLTEGYDAAYTSLFGASAGIETDDSRLLSNFGKVMAAYMGTLGRVQSPFDEDVRRFIAAAEAGEAEKDPAHFAIKTYFRRGHCASCHHGPLLSDNDFHVIGVEDPSDGAPGAVVGREAALGSTLRGDGTYSDDPSFAQGRLDQLEQELTEEHDAMVGAFRTPTLRNVALTAPYMHTGQLATLEDVIDFYDQGGHKAGSYQGTLSELITPLHLSGEEKKALLQLLESMTGTP